MIRPRRGPDKPHEHPALMPIPSQAVFSTLPRALVLGAGMLLGGCSGENWNNPYPPGDAGRSILYAAFEERPKHLDPARSYSSNEYAFIAQIYEPPLQYHFLKRPYELVPLAATRLPDEVRLDARGQPVAPGTPPDQVAFTEITVEIRDDLRYQPHPALARDAAGALLHHALGAAEIAQTNRLADFARSGTRAATAADYIYQIKRLADPATHCPIAALLGDYIVGFSDFGAAIKAKREAADSGTWIDLRETELPGVVALDEHRYRIRLKGQYPQFRFWLAMPFFSPMPWEADRFYAQPGLAERNISLDWYPIGTGPYWLSENNPNLRMVLDRNPHFRGEPYPDHGEPADVGRGLLADAGRPMPFIDRAQFNLEKENIPYWTKFLQGYYDSSGISSDSFDQAVQFGAGGDAQLTESMRAQGIELVTAVETSIFYTGFNWLDPVVGGDSDRARLLRQAIAIAVDYEEYISIFTNGRGLPAQGPLPPLIFGHRDGQAGINPYVYEWRDGEPRRRPIDDARALMREAGYPDGIDRDTGKSLVLYLDTVGSGPDSKARLNWFRKQFTKLGIQLVIRNTDYNRFQEKMLTGTAQIYQWGWNADYPDPENFFFLLYGPNAKVGHKGENASNYSNPQFDALFDRMKNTEDSPERLVIIDRMLDTVRRDGPWLWGFHPKAYSLHHRWVNNIKPNLMANNLLKYKRIDAAERGQARNEWNRPVVWPVVALVIAVLVSLIPAVWTWRRKQRARAL